MIIKGYAEISVRLINRDLWERINEHRKQKKFLQGRLSQESVAAVSLANQISFVMSLFDGAIIGAIGVLIAQYWGKQDYNKARDFLGMSIRYVIVISGIFFVVTFFFSEQLMSIFTTESELFSIGADYLKIVSFSYFFQA